MSIRRKLNDIVASDSLPSTLGVVIIILLLLFFCLVLWVQYGVASQSQAGAADIVPEACMQHGSMCRYHDARYKVTCWRADGIWCIQDEQINRK